MFCLQLYTNASYMQQNNSNISLCFWLTETCFTSSDNDYDKWNTIKKEWQMCLLCGGPFLAKWFWSKVGVEWRKYIFWRLYMLQYFMFVNNFSVYLSYQIIFCCVKYIVLSNSIGVSFSYNKWSTAHIKHNKTQLIHLQSAVTAPHLNIDIHVLAAIMPTHFKW